MPHRRIASLRAAIAFAHDVAMAPVSFVAALTLRLGVDDVWSYLREPDMLLALGVFTLVCGAVFWTLDLYRGIWRYASMPDLFAIARAVSLALLIFLAITFLMTRLEALPRSFLIIDWFVLIFLLAAPRLLYRLVKDGGARHVLERRSYRIPVLLVGASDAAELFIRDVQRTRENAYEPVGILDETGQRVGRRIHGVPVLGGVTKLETAIAHLARRNKAPQRLIVTHRLPRAQMLHLLDAAEANGMTLARLPRLTEFKAGAEDTGDAPIPVRSIAIEDLLGRPQVKLDQSALSDLIQDRCVLVTGAGGSIGAELVRQAASFGAARLILLDHAEFALYNIDTELAETWPGLPRRPVLADVRDKTGLNRLFAEEKPDLVLHAAALKHVPLAEANPAEAVLTNVVGTRNVVEAARCHSVRVTVQVSTDKAINPAGIMGATKRLAERYCQAVDLAERGRASREGSAPESGSAMRVVTVRFGNVLGSAGSVVPLFQRQIAKGGPVTVTHPDMTRYFMTVREAVQLVLQAAALGLDGTQTADGEQAAEVGKVYVLDMGEPVKIVDLARQAIRLAGFVPGKDIEIAYTGVRPGEKLYESLFNPDEATLPTRHPALHLAAARTSDLDILEKGVDELARQARTGRIEEMTNTLRRLVPRYQAIDDHESAAASG